MEKVVAGIISFNPEIKRLKENICAITIQCDCLYLIDNGSGNINDVVELLNKINDEKITLIRNNKNEGIARALNQLCEIALGNGYEWIITLDQDSVCPLNLAVQYKRYISGSGIGMLCPLIVDRNKNINKKIKRNKTTDISECITSGSMLNLFVWRKIGGFDEYMFIDGVDFDICHRIKKEGYRIIQINEVCLLHELGHITTHKILFLNVIVKNHTAFRKYYIARNTIYLAKKEHNKLLFIKSLLQNIKLASIVIFYESEKKEKLKSIYKGTLEGIRTSIL
jgi:rhamnosyltransferase